MKNAFFLVFSLFVLICFGVNVSHSGGEARSESKTFKKSDEGSYVRYLLSYSYGCTTVLKIWNSSCQLDLWHGEGCQAGIGNSVEVAASNFNDIVGAFDLQKQIKKSKLLTVGIGAHDAYEPLILFLNGDINWPDNYVEHFKGKAPSSDKAIELYREHLYNTILESGLYAPIFDVAKKLGCDAKLRSNLFDPLFFDKNLVSGSDLIEWGVIGDGEAKKELFPSAKGGLEFEMNCPTTDD